jgi:hypothetical protein
VRRLAVAVSTSISVALLLAGCGVTPLTQNDVSLSLDVTAPSDAVIGDSVGLAAHLVLAGNRTDVVKLTVQSSKDGRTWSNIANKREAGPRVSIKDVAHIKFEGTERYRAVVNDVANIKRLYVTGVKSVMAFDVKKMIRTFFYDETQAYAMSTKTGLAFMSDTNNVRYTDNGKSWDKYGRRVRISASERLVNARSRA